MRIVFRIVTLAAFGILAASLASAQNYQATLDGLQEVPPNASPATGSATLVLDAAKILHVNCQFAGLIGTLTASHIHAPAPPGSNAGVRFSLIPPAPPVSPIIVTVGPLTPAQEADLNGGLSYINIHTKPTCSRAARSGGRSRRQSRADRAPRALHGRARSPVPAPSP